MDIPGHLDTRVKTRCPGGVSLSCLVNHNHYESWKHSSKTWTWKRIRCLMAITTYREDHLGFKVQGDFSMFSLLSRVTWCFLIFIFHKQWCTVLNQCLKWQTRQEHVICCKTDMKDMALLKVTKFYLKLGQKQTSRLKLDCTSSFKRNFHKDHASQI